MSYMTPILKSLYDDLFYPVLLEKVCTRVVYLLQLSALRVRFLHWGTLIRWFRYVPRSSKVGSR